MRLSDTTGHEVAARVMTVHDAPEGAVCPFAVTFTRVTLVNRADLVVRVSHAGRVLAEALVPVRIAQQ